MYVNTTITNPDVETVIRAVASMLHQQMVADEEDEEFQPMDPDHPLWYFSEEK